MAQGVVAGPPRLEMRGVRKRFAATQALDGVDFAVRPGEVHALLGENGAGKSTLMKCLSGAVEPDEGEMLLDGQPYRPRGPLGGRRHGVCMIYQEFSLAPHLSVQDNIVLGVEPERFGLLARGEIRRRAVAALAELQHPEIRVDATTGSLPLAAQQIIEIARALAVGCRVLVLDEPTSSLSQRDAAQLFRVIERLRNKELAIVYITHFIEEAKGVASRFTVLRDGRTAGGGFTADATREEIVDLMVGRHVDELYPRSPRRAGEVVLEIDHLAGVEKPEDASLQLRRGEVLGIAGLVGAGRTELLRAVFGLDVVRRGRIRLGVYVGPASPARRWATGMGMLSEDRKGEGLAMGLSVASNVTLAGTPWFAPPARLEGLTSRWIEKLGVRSRSPRQRAGELSGGNQQKVALARLLHQDVDVLLLDEPTRGIDVASKAHIYELIDDLVARRDPAKAVLMVSSYLPELLGVCDRIAVMHRGKLGSALPVRDVDAQRLMLEASAGETVL